MRQRTRTRAALQALVVTIAVVAGGVLTPLAASAVTLYQATNVNFYQHPQETNFNWCSGSPWAFPVDNSTIDNGLQTNIGNDEGQIAVTLDFPVELESGSITITAPQGPEPSDAQEADAPWGTSFPTTSYYTDNAAAGDYGCTLTPGQNFGIYNYSIIATFPSGQAQPGTWLFAEYGFPTSAGNEVNIPFNFAGYGTASHLLIQIADVTNPVEGTYSGVQYSVQVNDPGGQYSDVGAPSQDSLSYVATTPNEQTSSFSESIPNGATSVSATSDPASGATLTATINDQYYNPISNVPIYIGNFSGTGQTEPVSTGSGNGEPVTNAAGQASYYAWSEEATPPGDPDEFFAEDTALTNFYITNSSDQEVLLPLTITAATPNPASAGGAYQSQIYVSPSNVNQQQGQLTVDQTGEVTLYLVDQFGNAESDNAISLVPILSPNQTTNDFKKVSVTPIDPPNASEGLDCDTGPASEIPGVSCTDDSGFTSFDINDATAQTVSFEITDETDGYTMPYTDTPPADEGNIPVLTFIAGPTSALTSTINVDGGSSANVLANGTAQAEINVTLLDDKGNPEVGHTVDLHETGVPITIASYVGTTNANGVAHFYASSSHLGDAYFTACDPSNSVCLNQTPYVDFVTGAVSPTLSTVAVTPAVVVGDGQGVSTVTVTIVDGGSHPLAGESVGLDLTNFPNLTVVPPAVVTDSNGVATFQVRSTSPENVSIPVDVAATSTIVLSQSADIDFVARPTRTSVVAAPTGVTEFNNSPEATGSPDETVTVTLADSTNTPLQGLTVELVAGSATSGPMMATNSSGQVVFPVSLAQNATDYTVTYVALDVSDNYRNIGSVTVTYVPIPDEQHQSTVLPSTQNVYTYDASQPAGTQTAVITVTLVSASGTVIAGHTVSLTPSTPYTTITPVQTQTGVTPGTSDANGQAQFDVTDCDVQPPGPPSCAPDSVDFTATDTSDSDVLVHTAHVNFVLRPDEAETSTITASPNAVEADGSTQAVITVTLKNNGALLSGDTVSLSQGAGHALISTMDPVSNTSGQVTFDVTDLTAEKVAIEATDLTTATELDADVDVTFTVPPGGTLQPAVTSVSPNSGTGNGGTLVTISGSNFSGASGVHFGTVSASSFSVTPSGTTILAVSPVPLAAGSVDVTVSGPGGTSSTSSGDIFTYSTGPDLTVADVSPNYVLVSNSEQVTIRGSGLLNTHHVFFGTEAAQFSVADAGQELLVTVPVSVTPGTVNVTLESSTSTSLTSSLDRFTYVGHEAAPVPPVIHGISPSSGSLKGGTLVKITGLHFGTSTVVMFGSKTAHVVTVNAAGTVLTVRSPSRSKVGTVAVLVRTSGGTSVASSVARFHYKSPTTRSHSAVGRTVLTTHVAVSTKGDVR